MAGEELDPGDGGGKEPDSSARSRAERAMTEELLPTPL